MGAMLPCWSPHVVHWQHPLLNFALTFIVNRGVHPRGVAGLSMWSFLSFLLIYLFVGVRADASLEPLAELIKPDEMSPRIELAIRTNQSLDPGFLDRVQPFRDYLYQVQETDLDQLLLELKRMEMEIYQQSVERTLALTQSDCGPDSLASLSQSTTWDFEKMLTQLGVRIVQSLPDIESPNSPARQMTSTDPQSSGDSKGGLAGPGAQGSRGISEKQLFVRAFDRDLTPLEAVRTEMISLEKTPRGVRGWQESSKEGNLSGLDSGMAAEKYWATVSWVDPKEKNLAPIPLVGTNTIRILESKFGGHLEGGIVFGKVASDWAIKFGSENVKHPIFLNERFEVMSADASHLPRYFVIAGVTEETGLIQLVSTQFPWSGSVRFPVLQGKATYLDLSRPELRKISGQVVDRESAYHSTKTEPSVVRVAGQSAPWTKTDSKGFFQLNQVLTFSHYPVFLDVQREGITTLRYRVLPEKLGAVVFYRMKEKEIDSWRAQLNLFHQDRQSGAFALNRESPLVVGYLRNPIARYSDLDLLPFLRLLPARPSWAPVAYVRSPGGLLEKDVYLSVHDSRVVGAHLANAGFLMGIHGEDGQTLYSEWGYTSPSVVNVLGPD